MTGFTDFWTAFTWTVFDWLSVPGLVIPVGVSLTLVFLVAKVPAGMKPLRRLIPLLLISYLLLATPFVASLLTSGLTRFLPIQTEQSADAIVVLSRSDAVGYARYDLAIQLWQAERAPKIFVTSLGRVGYMIDRLRREALPKEILDGTVCARTTYEEAVSTAAILRPKHVESIFLVTDAPHMLRSALTFQALGFRVLPQVAPFPSEFPTLQRSFLALREYLGLISYSLLGRLPRQGATSADRLPPETPQPSDCIVEWLTPS